MALTPEWSTRIFRWRETLKKVFYQPLGEVQLQAFMTKEHLPVEQAMRNRFTAVTPGAKWGAKWEYAWLRGKVVLPQAAKGERIVLNLNQYGEALIFVDGLVHNSFSWAQRHCTLAMSGKPGQRFDIAAEVYAGHGPTPCGDGPVPHGTDSVPEPPAKQQTFNETSFGIWNEDAYQAWVDLETLWQLSEKTVDKDSLRVAEIDAGLRDFTTIVDLELPVEQMNQTLTAGRKRLKPLLQAVNGSTVPTMYAFGHAHLDVAWLWPLAETKRKATRTLANQLALAEEYPGFKFLHSQTHLFRFVKDYYPQFYKRVKAAVKSGNVVPEGAMWVEADTNITSGESLIRQCIHGKRFFRDEFGVECEMLWLPDVFGYCGNLPQILAGCGVPYFTTQKIFWTYAGGEKFPHNTFWWEGIDGSKVLVHLLNDYNSQTGPSHTIERWNERVQKDGISTRLFPFGWGDGGGGPTRDHVEFLLRQKNLEGCPRMKMASPIDYFKDQERRGVPDVTYVGELYFQAHRGTLTSQARVKTGNRRAELALREAEFWGVAARHLKGMRFSAADLDAAWKDVLLCQFHDILPGSSIHRVYDEAEAMHNQVRATAAQWTAKATATLAGRGSESVTVFNSLSHERKVLVTLPKGFSGASLLGGAAVPVQSVKGSAMAEVSVPACGWVSLRNGPASRPVSTLKVSDKGLENEHLRLTLNRKGEISSIFDKDAKREISSGVCNRLALYKDVPGNFDAWDMDSNYELMPVDLAADADIQVVSRGPLVASVKVSRKVNNSTFVQEIRLRRNSRRVDFVTTVDWHEHHKLLKACFAVDIHANEAVHEIQMGHLRRPNHRSRPFDADRFEVCNHKWTALCEENRGAAVLNDCKYGVNVLGNSINLTLLKSAMQPDMTADQGKNQFTYAFYAWNGSFAECDLVDQAYDLNVPAVVASGAAGRGSLFGLSARNVVIETVKPAEDRSGDVVVRLYECKRMATKCLLATILPVARAQVTDMLENKVGEVAVKNGKMALAFKPFEIKTLRLKMK